MSLKNPRAQLLANLKCLYGSNVEVLTLCIPHDMFQAVAASFDPFTATWTRLLHSELVCTSPDAIDALLKTSEKELAKLLSASGNTVPFQGLMEQTFTLRRGGQRRDSVSANSMKSDPIVIATPESTLSDTGSCNFVEAEHPVEVLASGEPLVDKAEGPAEENWGSWAWGVSKTKRNAGKKAGPEPPNVEPTAEESAPLEDEWFSSKKKDKKKKGKSDVVEVQIEKPADDDFEWASFGKKDTKKKRKAVVEEPPKVEEPVKAPELEPEDDIEWINDWGKKDKKKGKNMPVEFIDETPDPNPASVPANDAEDDWGTWLTSKKDKAPQPTPTPPNPPEVELVSDLVEDTKQGELPGALPLPSPSLSASESAQLTQTLRTVVFTIKLPNELSDKSLQVMTTIADDTHTAIIESVNSYLDLQSISKAIQVQRKVKIKYGVGRNGNVDVSTLEENMWPQYLDYFSQYTRIPELTVEIME